MKRLFISSKVCVALTLLMAITNGVMAGTPPPPPPPPGGAPIDAGAVILLVVGAIMGAEKLYRRNKQKSKELISA